MENDIKFDKKIPLKEKTPKKLITKGRYDDDPYVLNPPVEGDQVSKERESLKILNPTYYDFYGNIEKKYQKRIRI